MTHSLPPVRPSKSALKSKSHGMARHFRVTRSYNTLSKTVSISHVCFMWQFPLPPVRTLLLHKFHCTTFLFASNWPSFIAKFHLFLAQVDSRVCMRRSDSVFADSADAPRIRDDGLFCGCALKYLVQVLMPFFSFSLSSEQCCRINDVAQNFWIADRRSWYSNLIEFSSRSGRLSSYTGYTLAYLDHFFTYIF